MKNIDMGEFSLGKVKLNEDVVYEVCTEEEIDFYDRTIRNNYIKGLHIISNEDMAKVITEYRKQQYSNSKF